VGDRKLVRAQPAGQLLHQALGALQTFLGVFDAVEQFDLRVEDGRRLDPFEQFGRHAVGGVEHVEQHAAAAALQPGARQSAHGADVEAADALEPGGIGPRRRRQRARQAVEAAHERFDAQDAASAPARQHPAAARGGSAAEVAREAEGAQAGAHAPAQGADAAEQAQAGADVDQDRRFLGLGHLRRVLQQRHCHRVQGFGFAFGRALDDARLGQQHQHAAAAHAELDAGGVCERRGGQHPLPLEHDAAAVS
jgi:hypothetical protein